MAFRITWLGHATVLIEAGATRVLTDPVLRRRVGHLARHGAVPSLPAPLHAVLLSHLHRDHADRPTLRRLAGVPIVAPRGTRTAVGRGLEVREVGVGDTVALPGGATVEVVPARHDTRRHPVAGARTDALGFVVVADGHRAYFAGDTDLFAGMQHIGEAGLDVALLPVWGWGPSIGPGHLDPERAARAAALLAPRVAIPVHWGTYLPIGLRRRHAALLERPAREFAEHARRLAPGVEVRILEPGVADDV
jgi:L-ascorbate metabolism protein UlaG (beta-lactamase superfamily)